MILDLERDYPIVTGWRIQHDVGEIPIQRHQDCFQFLRLREDDGSSESLAICSLRRKTS
jgi:hypothetical protein